MIPQTTYMALCRRSAHREYVRLPMPSGLICIISLLQVSVCAVVHMMAMQHDNSQAHISACDCRCSTQHPARTLRIIRTHSVARVMADWVTSSGCRTPSSRMSLTCIKHADIGVCPATDRDLAWRTLMSYAA